MPQLTRNGCDFLRPTGGTPVALNSSVNRHFLGISLYLILAVGLVFLVVMLEWLWLAFAVLISAPVLGAVWATAFLRAKGRSPEHHPPVDRYVNDSDP